MNAQVIYRFADKWLHRFENPDTPEDEFETRFGIECGNISFTMDCGAAFNRAYPESNAFSTPAALSAIIERVNDPGLLGSAIYSQWRYYQHWAESLIDRAWFVVALKRLQKIAKQGLKS